MIDPTTPTEMSEHMVDKAKYVPVSTALIEEIRGSLDESHTMPVDCARYLIDALNVSLNTLVFMREASRAYGHVVQDQLTLLDQMAMGVHQKLKSDMEGLH